MTHRRREGKRRGEVVLVVAQGTRQDVLAGVGLDSEFGICGWKFDSRNKTLGRERERERQRDRERQRETERDRETCPVRPVKVMWKRPRALNLLRLKSATPTSIVEKPLGLGIHRTTPSSLYRSPSLSRCSPSPCRRFSSLFTTTVFSTSVGSFIESAGSSVSDFFPVPSHTETETGAERERVSLTGIVHKVWQGVYQKGDVLVDATLGKGRDTMELARLANLFTTSSSSSSPSDEVRLVGFDIQAEAVELTRENLRGAFDSDEAEGWQCSQIALYHCSHSELSARLAECGINPGDVGIVCFSK